MPQIPLYFRPRNWSKFQSQSNNSLPWIKNYTALLSDPDYLELNDHQRGVLHGLWLLFGMRRRPLEWSCRYLNRALGTSCKHLNATLGVLKRRNFIELCDATFTDKSRGDEKRGDKKTPIVPFEDSDFETFWQGHPRQRRGSKEKAIAAWKRALLRSPSNEILAGHRDYIESDEVRDGFAKGAAAWLNDDRWKTDYLRFRKKTTAEMREAFINGDQGSGLGRDPIDGECVEVPEGGFGRGGGSLPVGIEGSVGRPSEDGGDGPDEQLVETGAAQASGYLEDSERTKAAVKDLAAIAAKRAKP